MDHTISLSTNSLLVTLGVLFLLTVLPVKLGANFVGAVNNSFGNAAVASAIGLITGIIIFKLLSGLPSVIAAYIVISIVYWLVLKPSLAGAFGLTFVVIILQAAIVQGLSSIVGSVGS
jgi:hypothetical protein